MAKTKAESEGERKWPAHNLVDVPIAELRFNPNNTTAHTKEEIEDSARSLARFGWTNRPLIDEANMILAGERRVLAAQLRGVSDVPCMRAVGWSQDEKDAYATFDNASTKQSAWKDEALSATLDRLGESGFDMRLVGFPDYGKGEGEPEKEIEVHELVDTGQVKDECWISVRGPLAQQAEILQALREVMKRFPAVEVDLGTIPVEAS